MGPFVAGRVERGTCYLFFCLLVGLYGVPSLFGQINGWMTVRCRAVPTFTFFFFFVDVNRNQASQSVLVRLRDFQVSVKAATIISSGFVSSQD